MATTTVERAYVLKDKMHELAQAMPDAEALQFPELFKTWGKGNTYAKGEKVLRRGELFRSKAKHQAKAGWEPEKLEKWERVVVEEVTTDE